MDALFYLFAVVAVLASLGWSSSQRNPMHSVAAADRLVRARCPGSISLLDAPFVAVIQIIVYAGAIMVLFLFVVMLLNAPHEDPPTAYGPSRVALTAGARRRFAVLAVVLVGRAGLAHSQAALPPTDQSGRDGAGGVGARDRHALFHDVRVRVRSHVRADSGGDGRRGACSARRSRH